MLPRRDHLLRMPSAGMSHSMFSEGSTGLEEAASLPQPSPKPPLPPRMRMISRNMPHSRKSLSMGPASPGSGTAAPVVVLGSMLTPPEALSKETSISQEVAATGNTLSKSARLQSEPAPRPSNSSQQKSEVSGHGDSSGKGRRRSDGAGLGDGAEKAPLGGKDSRTPLGSIPAEDSGVLQKVLRGAKQKWTLATGGFADALVMQDLGISYGRAHDTRLEAILAREPYLFTAAAASGVCDAQIKVWVQGRDQDTKEYDLSPL
jgi:hypothetical protein